MTKELNIHELLTLHYVYPLALHKFQHLQKHLGTLDRLNTCPAWKLATILNITVENANALKEQYTRMLNVSLEEHYEHHGITPIPFTSESVPAKITTVNRPANCVIRQGGCNIIPKT